ncbi:Lysophosphatidylcholine acyltransferase 3, partial [Quaeritorhiza haematococci]
MSFEGYRTTPAKTKASSIRLQPIWNGLANCRPEIIEWPWALSDMVISFNVNTNMWSKVYVFKRLRFLGSKSLSTFLTLSFLALWHGHHLGYFLCFYLEFIDLACERRWKSLIRPFTTWLYPESSTTSEPKEKMMMRLPMMKRVLRVLFRLGAYFWTTFMFGYALVSFHAVHWGPIVKVWGRLGFVGHWVLVAILLLDVIKPLFIRPQSLKKRVDLKNKDSEVNGNGTTLEVE